MCKHIIVACLGVGIIYFILETTVFSGLHFPSSDISVTFWIYFPPHCASFVGIYQTHRCWYKNQERHVFFLTEKWVRGYRWVRGYIYTKWRLKMKIGIDFFVTNISVAVWALLHSHFILGIRNHKVCLDSKGCNIEKNKTGISMGFFW